MNFVFTLFDHYYCRCHRLWSQVEQALLRFYFPFIFTLSAAPFDLERYGNFERRNLFSIVLWNFLVEVLGDPLQLVACHPGSVKSYSPSNWYHNKWRLARPLPPGLHFWLLLKSKFSFYCNEYEIANSFHVSDFFPLLSCTFSTERPWFLNSMILGRWKCHLVWIYWIFL